MGNLDIEEALLAVVVAEFVQIVVELVVLEAPGTGQPGEHPPLLGLHLTLEGRGLDVLVADKLNIGDFDLLAFLDLENDRAETAHPVLVDRVRHGNLIVAGFLVVLDQFARVVLHLALIEREIRAGLGLLLKAAALDLHIALELHRQHAVLRRDFHDEVQGIPLDHFLLELD